MSAPVLVERVPVVSGPVKLPAGAPESLLRGWPLAAALSGAVAVGLLIVAVVVL